MNDSNHPQQELIVKTGSNRSAGDYGSAAGASDSDDIVINKSSYFSAKCGLKYLPLILSIIAVIMSIVAVVLIVQVANLADDAEDTLKELEIFATATTTTVGLLSRNFILSQFAAEQRIRSQGDSGITNVRQHNDGDEMYDDGTYSNGAISAIHDHADFINLAGMGEVSAVLNGVEFQTRHNDYNLAMPSVDSSEYGATERIPQPNVPPQVLAFGDDIDGQISELQEWFRAFKTQNKSHRYYPDYFKPILCYLEGTWIMDAGVLEEPFESDRHAFDAVTWNELHDKFRYMVNSGRKDLYENLAHLPSSIRNLIGGIYPAISNWEYRIACVPLKNDVPTARFRVSNDLSVQLLSSPLTRQELYYHRRSRFEISKYINLTDPDGDSSYPNGYWQTGSKRWNYLDYLMEQVPGKDNFIANLTDELPGGVARVTHFNDASYVNSGYYNRFYGLSTEDAMGATQHRRSYNDRYLFAAKTSQQRVSPISMLWEIDKDTGAMEPVESRWSYAIPLEIIYTTPLVNWNPLDIKWYPMLNSTFGDDPTMGSCEENKPYEGWGDFNSYYTPAAFFQTKDEGTSADTAQSDRCVLDQNGEMHPVFPSGHWITFPRIGGDVGYVRQRYPIPPIHIGGHGTFKDLKALQTLLLGEDYDDSADGLEFFGDGRDRIYGFDVTVSGGSHAHILHIAGWKINSFWVDDATDQYYNGSAYTITGDTDIANGHQHAVIAWRYRETESSAWQYVIDQCAFGTENDPGEWMDDQCADGHTALVRGYL